MKLITHNLLMCNKSGCTTNNFPLRVICTKVEEYDSESVQEYSKALMQRLLEKIDYLALQQTVNSLKWGVTLPEGPLDQSHYENEEFLQLIHDVCCKRHITEGALQCPNCEREYQIKNGIANMLLTEEEV